MTEENIKNGLSLREIFPKEMEDLLKLPPKEKFRMVHFVVALALILGAENHSIWITGCLTFNLLYAAYEAKKVYNRIRLDNMINHKLEKENYKMNDESLNGLFNGANFKDVQIVIAQKGATVVYKQAVSSRNEITQVTNEQIANAIRAINGKGKPLDGYQLWLGACCLLSWKYDFPRNLRECCERINALPLEGVEYICKYDNIRKFPGVHAFAREDVRQWDSYKPKEDERNFFNGCLSVSQALDTEIQKQIAMGEG